VRARRKSNARVSSSRSASGLYPLDLGKQLVDEVLVSFEYATHSV